MMTRWSCAATVSDCDEYEEELEARLKERLTVPERPVCTRGSCSTRPQSRGSRNAHDDCNQAASACRVRKITFIDTGADQ